MKFLRLFILWFSLWILASGPVYAAVKKAVKNSVIPSVLVTEKIKPGSDFFTKNMREVERRNRLQLLLEKRSAQASRRPSQKAKNPEKQVALPADLIEIESNYILSAQFLEPGHPAHGAINNVYGDPTWVVPRENALAILALVMAYDLTGDANLLEKANLAADYLVRVQDSDGAWYDQYDYADPYLFSKSPTQTAEVMIAFYKLGYNPARYEAMKKGAQFLMACQDPANKQGADDGLLGGGKMDDGSFHTYRWASDNSFAYWAFEAAEQWARYNHDRELIRATLNAGRDLKRGINQYLYVRNPSDPDFGVWRRVIDQNGVAVDPGYHEWINYAPQMLDLPVRGVGIKRVGTWIKNNLQKSDGAVVWDNDFFSERKSPGLSFQASLVWLDLRQSLYSDAALEWAEGSGLWQTDPDSIGVAGGWIDWIENGTPAPEWQRFIDTSFYAIAAYNGGYDFRIRRRDLFG